MGKVAGDWHIACKPLYTWGLVASPKHPQGESLILPSTLPLKAARGMADSESRLSPVPPPLSSTRNALIADLAKSLTRSILENTEH